jgi:hypothetical protein
MSRHSCRSIITTVASPPLRDAGGSSAQAQAPVLAARPRVREATVLRGADSKTFVWHGGSCPGHQTRLSLQPDEKIATVAMSSGMHVNAGALARRMYEIVAPALKAASGDSPRSLKALAPDLAQYRGTNANAWRGETELVAWEGGGGAAPERRKGERHDQTSEGRRAHVPTCAQRRQAG